LSTLTAAAFIASTAQSGEIIGQSKVESDWFEGKVRWTQGPPAYKYMWKVRIRDGVVVLCGVGKIVSANLGSASRQVIKDRGFYIDDTLYYDDITFFTKVPRSTKLIGAQANCVSTGKRLPKQVKDGVSIQSMRPNRVYRN